MKSVLDGSVTCDGIERKKGKEGGKEGRVSFDASRSYRAILGVDRVEGTFLLRASNLINPV